MGSVGRFAREPLFHDFKFGFWISFAPPTQTSCFPPLLSSHSVVLFNLPFTHLPLRAWFLFFLCPTSRGYFRPSKIPGGIPQASTAAQSSATITHRSSAASGCTTTSSWSTCLEGNSLGPEGSGVVLDVLELLRERVQKDVPLLGILFLFGRWFQVLQKKRPWFYTFGFWCVPFQGNPQDGFRFSFWLPFKSPKRG